MNTLSLDETVFVMQSTVGFSNDSILDYKDVLRVLMNFMTVKQHDADNPWSMNVEDRLTYVNSYYATIGAMDERTKGTVSSNLMKSLLAQQSGYKNLTFGQIYNGAKESSNT